MIDPFDEFWDQFGMPDESLPPFVKQIARESFIAGLEHVIDLTQNGIAGAGASPIWVLRAMLVRQVDRIAAGRGITPEERKQ